MKGDDISERLLDFAVRVLRLIGALPKRPVGRHIANHLLRSSSSAGSNYEEARGAESLADFIHKLGVSWKETRESWCWLRLVYRAELIKPRRVEPLLQEADELCAILAKSLATSRKRLQGETQKRRKGGLILNS
jgi:four helix bundle protein